MKGRLLIISALVGLAACSGPRAQLDHARDLTFHSQFRSAAAQYQSLLVELGRDESPQAQALRAAALSELGQLEALRLNDPEGAVQCYHKLAERYPERPEAFDARVQLADLLAHRFNDPRGALVQLAALVQSFPNHTDTDRYQYQLAKGYFALGDYAQTETEARLLLAHYPGSVEKIDTRMLLASSLALQGHRAEAIKLYQQVVALGPGADASRAHLEIGRLYEGEGDLPRAEVALAKALPDSPNPGVVKVALSRVKRRAALRQAVDIHDRAAIFDHKASQRVVATAAPAAPATASRAVPKT